jgi:hypothetical protein
VTFSQPTLLSIIYLSQSISPHTFSPYTFTLSFNRNQPPYVYSLYWWILIYVCMFLFCHQRSAARPLPRRLYSLNNTLPCVLNSSLVSQSCRLVHCVLMAINVASPEYKVGLTALRKPPITFHLHSPARQNEDPGRYWRTSDRKPPALPLPGNASTHEDTPRCPSSSTPGSQKSQHWLNHTAGKIQTFTVHARPWC